MDILGKLTSLNSYWSTMHELKEEVEELFLQIELAFHCNTDKQVICNLFSLIIPKILAVVDHLDGVYREMENFEQFLTQTFSVNSVHEIENECVEVMQGIRVLHEMRKHHSVAHGWIRGIINDAKALVQIKRDDEEMNMLGCSINQLQM